MCLFKVEFCPDRCPRVGLQGHLLRKENHGLGEETCGCLMGGGGSGRDWEESGAWAYQTQLRIDLQGDPAE